MFLTFNLCKKQDCAVSHFLMGTALQVLGHAKTVLVLFIGWALLGESISHTQLVGVTLTITGMILYGYFSSRPQQKHA